MFENMENSEIVSASYGFTKSSGFVASRKRFGFVFRIGGTVEYTVSQKRFVANPGDVVFLPKGIAYEYRTLHSSEAPRVAINFETATSNLQSAVFSLSDFFEKDFIYKDFVNLWKFGTPADRYRCTAVFYNLLSYLSNIEGQSYAEKKHFHVIDPAVEYLQAHIFSPTLKIGELHKRCGVSDAYFRKIFVSRFGMPPSKYIITKRLSHAKAIIENGDFDTLGCVGAEVGFTDPLYFSRSFKKKYGVSPSQMNKEV